MTVPVRPRPPMQWHGDTDAALDVVDDVVRGREHDVAFAFGIGGWIAAHQILQAKRANRARRGVVRRDVVGEAHDVADAFRVQQRPVGAAGIRHACERDGVRAHPVELVGNAEVAEEPCVRADGQQAQRHREVHVIEYQARKRSPGFTSGVVPRPSASIVAVIGSIAAKSPRGGT